MSRYLALFFSRLWPWVVLVHALAFIAFWLTNRLFYASSNDYLADMLGRRLDYVSLLLWVSAFITLWSCLRGILSLLHTSHKLAVLTAWVYGIISLLFVVFFYGSFWLLFTQSPVQLVRIGQLVAYFRIFLDALLLLGLALLAAFLLRSSLRIRTGVKRISLVWVLVVVVYLVLWSLPLFFPPSNVIRHAMADKPLIIAHRGASMLAPENTLVAAERAVELGVYGLETDVQVSLDGGLFLLHDDTFDRTTDIRSIFPGREEQPAGDFTIAEISQLNAGDWFVQQDPFHAIRRGSVSPDQIKEYQQQAVPLLMDWLDIVREHHLAFRFDLKPPSEGHPYATSFFELTLDQVHQAGIDSQIWFIVDLEQLQTLLQFAPEMIPTYGAEYQSLPAAADLKSQGYQVVNVEYGISPEWIRQYRAAGLWVDVFTVDEPWQFSRLWLLGVNSITTSNAGVMAHLQRPTFSLPLSQYVLVWGMVGLLGLGMVVLVVKSRS